MAKKKGTSASPSNGPAANLGFEANLWLTADKCRKDMDAAENPSKDVFDSLGRVYEDFLTQFASAEGKNGEQFDTPRCVVRVLVAMLAPYNGRVYDPCCGSAGMFALQVDIHDAAPRGEFLEVSIPWNRTLAVASQKFGESSPMIAHDSRMPT